VEPWIEDALRTARVARLATVGADGATRLVPICFVVIDGWIAGWSRVWWIRVNGRAVVHREESAESKAARAALIAKYVQYRERPPSGAVYRIALDEVRTWRADPS